MNERIKELMEKAVSFRFCPDSLAYEAQVDHEDLEYFAELIVRECADTVLGFRNQFGDSAHNEIREHFGVEE